MPSIMDWRMEIVETLLQAAGAAIGWYPRVRTSGLCTTRHEMVYLVLVPGSGQKGTTKSKARHIIFPTLFLVTAVTAPGQEVRHSIRLSQPQHGLPIKTPSWNVCIT